MYAGTSRSWEAVIQMDEGVCPPPDVRAVSSWQLHCNHRQDGVSCLSIRPCTLSLCLEKTRRSESLRLKGRTAAGYCTYTSGPQHDCESGRTSIGIYEVYSTGNDFEACWLGWICIRGLYREWQYTSPRTDADITILVLLTRRYDRRLDCKHSMVQNSRFRILGFDRNTRVYC